MTNTFCFTLIFNSFYNYNLIVREFCLFLGQVKNNWMAQNNSEQNISEDDETQILMQSLYDTNLPKFLKEDVILFHNLMNDLFPNCEKPKKKQEIVEKSVNIATRELNYQFWPSQYEKVHISLFTYLQNTK